MHPRYRVVTQADNIMKREQEYLKKLRTKSHISEKAYDEAFKSGAASLRWQDSVKQFKFGAGETDQAVVDVANEAKTRQMVKYMQQKGLHHPCSPHQHAVQ